jgi:hypothetical protein
MARIVLDAAKEWPRLFRKRDNLTLRVCESSSYPQAFGFECRGDESAWRFTQFVWKLLPSPDLWILLDTTIDRMLSGNPSLTREDAERKLESYRSFARTRKNCIVLDASRPVDTVAEEAYAAIINALVRRTQIRLKKRFPQSLTFDKGKAAH